MNFNQIKSRFDYLCKQPKDVPQGIRGVIIGLLDRACGSKENRYQFAAALGIPAHSKAWSDGQWYAISMMCKTDKVGGEWMATEPNFQKIVDIVLRSAVEKPEQITMFDETKIKHELGFYD